MGKKRKEREKEMSKGERSPALFAQPMPKSDGPDIWPLVIKDMADRDHLGKTKYGIPLRSHNGRDALVDAYQEVLDMSVYLRQEIEERRDLIEAFRLACALTGEKNPNLGDLARVITSLTEKVEKQQQQIRALSATVMHYQTQSSFVAGYDKGAETAIEILERLRGEPLPADHVNQVLDAAISRRQGDPEGL